jgi:branched-chain amino acid transport system ATP-binding protein
MAALLKARGLAAYYGPSQVLFGIDFEVAVGGITTVLGANGAGKTTTLRAVCGMIRSEGEVTLDGASIQGLATEDVVRRGIGHVPDGRGTFTGLTVEENLRLGAFTRRDKAAVAADLDQVYGYFPRLQERRQQQAGTLSGGEQQMLAIGRALMIRPRLMLLDEPSFGLAPIVVQGLFDILRAINRDQGIGMLLVEQDAALALELADAAYLLETGRVVMSGDTEVLKNDDAVRKAYLGY